VQSIAPIDNPTGTQKPSSAWLDECFGLMATSEKDLNRSIKAIYGVERALMRKEFGQLKTLRRLLGGKRTASLSITHKLNSFKY
jgi:hypothetical protein